MTIKRAIAHVAAGLCLLGALLGPPAAPARAQAGQRCFGETGFCIAGVIREYWERNGGLAVFGYPIGSQIEGQAEGWTGQLQWFQRDRLEDHGPQGVLAGRLGARYMELFAVHPAARQTLLRAPTGCAFFIETKHSLCEPFLSYWRRNGGLERFGFPLSEPITEEQDGWRGTVQYFERRRMEHHQEHRGTPYEVLLGLLGRDIYTAEHCEHAWFFTPRPLYCPSQPARPLEGALERFERGLMIWTKAPDAFHIFADQNRHWSLGAPYRYKDPAPPPFDETPPEGRYVPTSGFADLWLGRFAYPPGTAEPPQPLREVLGWATEPEQVYQGSIQCYFGGPSYYSQRCYMRGAGEAVVFFDPGGGAGRWP